MALKPYLQINPADTYIDYFMNVVGEKGQFVVHDTAGSGEALDDANNVVALPTGDIGDTIPAGLLFSEVVDKDLTQNHLNVHKMEVQVGGKVCIAKRGSFLTNRLASGDTPTVGDALHYDDNGDFTTTTTSPKVGRFMGEVDADGYVKIDLNVV
jgi:hypothetical protein